MDLDKEETCSILIAIIGVALTFTLITVGIYWGFSFGDLTIRLFAGLFSSWFLIVCIAIGAQG